mmetsp:Transcript_30216/g.72475  ORF Transcript_30216/g.72475 Transcript_30216/m.72475 type:complete len:300 (-) Transcript_30216:95-994(-)
MRPLLTPTPRRTLRTPRTRLPTPRGRTCLPRMRTPRKLRMCPRMPATMLEMQVSTVRTTSTPAMRVTTMVMILRSSRARMVIRMTMPVTMTLKTTATWTGTWRATWTRMRTPGMTMLTMRTRRSCSRMAMRTTLLKMMAWMRMPAMRMMRPSCRVTTTRTWRGRIRNPWTPMLTTAMTPMAGTTLMREHSSRTVPMTNWTAMRMLMTRTSTVRMTARTPETRVRRTRTLMVPWPRTTTTRRMRRLTMPAMRTPRATTPRWTRGWPTRPRRRRAPRMRQRSRLPRRPPPRMGPPLRKVTL